MRLLRLLLLTPLPGLETFAGLPERTLCWEWCSHGIQWYAAMRGDMKLLDMNGTQFLKRLQADLEAWKASEVKR